MLRMGGFLHSGFDAITAADPALNHDYTLARSDQLGLVLLTVSFWGGGGGGGGGGKWEGGGGGGGAEGKGSGEVGGGRGNNLRYHLLSLMEEYILCTGFCVSIMPTLLVDQVSPQPPTQCSQESSRGAPPPWVIPCQAAACV